MMKVHVCCVFSLESPHRGESKENIKKKITLYYSKSATMGFFQGTQECLK